MATETQTYEGLTVRVTKDVAEWLAQQAERNYRSRSKEVQRILEAERERVADREGSDT